MKKNKGFTLFELLVSISIIAILTALAIVSYSAAQKKARDARREEDMQNIQKAAEQYYMLSNSSYPTTSSGSWTTASGTVVLQSFPIDPKSGNYTIVTNLATGYCFCATLENNTGNASAANCSSWVNGTGGFYCVNNQQ